MSGDRRRGSLGNLVRTRVGLSSSVTRISESNCLGCNVRLGEVPTAWQLDFPNALSYLGDTTGSCSDSLEIVGTTPASRYDVSHQFEYPDISDFGLGTVVEIDAAPVTNPLLPFTSCVWASSNFYIYEEAHGPAVEPSFGCIDGSLPFASKGPDILLEHWWEKRLAFASDLIGYGLSNRTRSVMTPTSSDCGFAPSGCVRGTTACGFYVYGIYARMRVDQSPFRLTLDVIWAPRRFNSYVLMRQYSGFAWKPYVGYANWSPVDIASIGGLGECGYALYPYATATQNIGSGIMLRYSRTINCATDLEGGPLLFTKFDEPKQRAEATQTRLEAAGITGAPDEITMTPIA